MKKLSIQNILVPIDFSEMSIEAIETARRLARLFNGIVHLAHVRQIDYTAAFAAGSTVPFSILTYNGDAQKQVVQNLNALACECHVSSPICHVLGGAPAYDEICRLAHQIPADLIVMPTHGRTGLKHVFLGSTAEKIVQHSSCPVLVTRRNALKSNNRSQVRITTILVPVDFSSCSREGLRYAIAFANEFGARIILVHATFLGYIYSAEGTAIYDIPALQQAARKVAERKMGELVQSVNFGTVEFETAFTDGSPVIDICTFAKDHDVDLIITSTHGFTGFTHVLIGSIAEQAVRHAPCSVLVVPSHPHVRAANLIKSGAAKASALATKPRSRKSPGGRARLREKIASKLY
jgi:nucleotide-binding universal stress UspA family protein